MTTSTTSPIQDITTAEAEAKKSVEEAKNLTTQEVDAYKREEEKRKASEEERMKEEAAKELEAEKEGLVVILKEGKEKTKNEIKKLQEKVEKNKGGIVSDLVDQFISFFTK